MHGRDETKGSEFTYTRVVSRKCAEIILSADIRTTSREQRAEEGNSREINGIKLESCEIEGDYHAITETVDDI